MRSNRFRNILWVTPPPAAGHTTVARYVNDLAALHDAAVTAFDVIEPIPPLQRDLPFGGRPPLSVEQMLSEHTSTIGKLADELDRSPATHTVVKYGRRAPEVVRQIRDQSHDLVVVTPAGRTATAVKRLVRAAPCPVLVLRPIDVPPGPIVVALDPTDSERLNSELLGVATITAKLTNQPLHVVHAFEPIDDSLYLAVEFTPFEPSDLSAHVARIRAAHTAAVAATLDSIGLDIDAITHVERGEAHDVIARVGREVNASMLVVGTGGHRALPALFVGHTAEKLITRTQIPLLTVRQPGFDDHIGDVIDLRAAEQPVEDGPQSSAATA